MTDEEQANKSALEQADYAMEKAFDGKPEHNAVTLELARNLYLKSIAEQLQLMNQINMHLVSEHKTESSIGIDQSIDKEQVIKTMGMK